MTEKSKLSKRQYDKHNTRTFSLKFNRNTDADLIAWLESCENIQGYIKKLISADIKRY